MSSTGLQGWVPDRLLRWLLAWTALTTVVFWLATVRGAFDGTSYQWGLFGLGGRGVHGAYWLPVLGSAFALLLQTLGWRGAKRPFHFMLLAWHGFLAVTVIYFAASAPRALRFRGDTLGIDVSLAVVGPLFFTAWAGLALYWVVGHFRQASYRDPLAWARRNGYWIGALLGFLPVQFVLLRFGAPGSASDQAGVLLTIGQWLLVGRSLRPYPVEAAQHAAGADR